MLDLHHYSIHDAWCVFNNYIDDAYYNGDKSVHVITGKGLILLEFRIWMELHPRISGGHLNADSGSWIIRLKKLA